MQKIAITDRIFYFEQKTLKSLKQVTLSPNRSKSLTKRCIKSVFLLNGFSVTLSGIFHLLNLRKALKFLPARYVILPHMQLWQFNFNLFLQLAYLHLRLLKLRKTLKFLSAHKENCMSSWPYCKISTLALMAIQLQHFSCS